MTEPHDPDEAVDGPGQELAAALGGQTWQLDVEPAAAAPNDPLPPITDGPSAAPVASPTQMEAPPPPPLRVIEALLFAGGVPLTAEQAAGLIRGLMPEQFRLAIDTLNRDYRRQGRPYLIEASPAGWVLTVRRRFDRVREKLVGAPRAARLSQPALDVLAIVAYRQPVTRADVETFRGTESGSVLRQLVRLGLIGGAADPARPSETAYGTTPRFLELFGLMSLDDLPRTGDLQKL